MPAENPPAPAKTSFGGDGEIARILESISDGFFAFDADWRFTYVNEAAERLLMPHVGDVGALPGRNLWEAFPETVGTILEREYRRAVAEGVAVEIEYFHAPWQRWYAVRANQALSTAERSETDSRRLPEG